MLLERVSSDVHPTPQISPKSRIINQSLQNKDFCRSAIKFRCLYILSPLQPLSLPIFSLWTLHHRRSTKESVIFIDHVSIPALMKQGAWVRWETQTKFLVGKLEGKGPIERLSRRCQNNHQHRLLQVRSVLTYTNKLHGLSPWANYTDRATAACRRSDC
jgi:hypothetical protein